MLSYKVVEIKQKSMLKGYMTALDLQNLINQWAHLGWMLDRMSAGETQGFLHSKDVFLLIFKREISIPPDLFVMVDGHPVEATESSLGQLKSLGKLTPNTVACFKGMTDWKPIANAAPDLAIVLFG